MTRSHKKSPVTGWSLCKSEASCKKIWHRKWRRGEKTNLINSFKKDIELHITLHYRDISNPWLMGKDGKQILSKKNQNYKYMGK